jgi:hypothetical protein
MIRNSDILFGRTAATYQFADRETIRQAIREISSLQVVGIDKRIPQIMFERGYLNREQIYAILESLLQSHQIKSIYPLQTYLWSDQDEKLFFEYLGLPYGGRTLREVEEIPQQIAGKKLPISAESLLLCLNIKQTLEKGGIKVKLLSVIADKKLLTPQFAEILPHFASTKQTIITSQGRDEKQMRKSIAILFSQIAIVNEKLSQEHLQKALPIWESVSVLGLNLKYSELLFYLGYLDAQSTTRLASFLGSISGIDQHPRFPLFRLSREEKKFFDQLLEKGAFRSDILNTATQFLEKMKKLGLHTIRLSDVLILQGYLSRKMIARKWAEIRKKEMVEEVKKLQLERTEESKTLAQMNQKLNEELLKSQEVAKKAEAEVAKYYENAQQLGYEVVTTTQQEASQFEAELDETFRTSQEIQKAVIQKEVATFKNRVGKVGKEEAKPLHVLIDHYQSAQNHGNFYITIILLILGMMLLGFLFAWYNTSSEQAAGERAWFACAVGTKVL